VKTVDKNSFTFLKKRVVFVAELKYIIFVSTLYTPASSVGIATDYGLDDPRSNPGGDEIFRPYRPVLGLCTMGTGSFPGVEAAGAWG